MVWFQHYIFIISSLLSDCQETSKELLARSKILIKANFSKKPAKKIFTPIDFEIGAHTGAKKEFLHTVYAPFYGAPSVYALVS